VFPRLFMTIPTVETEGEFGSNSTIFKVAPKWESAVLQQFGQQGRGESGGAKKNHQDS